MKRLIRTLGCAAALSLTASSVAHAATFINNVQYCGGNTFSTCAYITASTTVNGSGNTVLTLTVTNPITNPAGSTFTAIGIGDLNGATLLSTSTSDPNFTFSTSPNGLIGAGIESDVIGFNSVPPITANGILPGETVTFTFTFAGSTLNTADLQFAIHDQGGAPVGCDASTKLVIDNTTPNGAFAANVATCGPPPTVTPEPASMVLFGTGLMGLAGIVVRRRKSVA